MDYFKSKYDKKFSGWNLVNIINFCQGIPLGMSFAVFNLPREDVLEWIDKITKNEGEFGLEKVAITTNLTTPIIKTDEDYSAKTLNIMSIIVSIYMIGSFLGAILAGWLNQKKGAKFTMTVNCYILLISTICCHTGITILDSHVLLTIGRLLGGMFAGISNTIVPIYYVYVGDIKEVPAYVASYMLILRVGLLLGTLLGLDVIFGSTDLWFWIILIPVVPGVCQLCINHLIPEGPDYNVQEDERKFITQFTVVPVSEDEEKKLGVNIKGRDNSIDTKSLFTDTIDSQEGKLLSTELRIDIDEKLVNSGLASSSEESGPVIQNQIIYIGEDSNLKNQKMPALTSDADPNPANFSDLFKIKELKAATFYTVFLSLIYVFNGSQEVVQYSTVIIQSFKLDKNTTQILCVSVPVIFIFISIFAVKTVDKMNRRTQLLLTTISCMFSSCLFMLLGHLDAEQSPFINYLILIPMIITLAAFTFGLGNIVFTLPSEFTPKKYVGLVQSVEIAVFYLFSSVSLYIFPLLKNWLQCDVFIIFVVSNFLGTVYVYFRGVETRGRDLDEIQFDFMRRRFCC